MKLSERFLDGALGVTALVAVATSFLVVDRGFSLGIFDRSPRPSAEEVDDWEELDDTGHRFGSQGALVSMVVFSDYQCVYCKMLDRTIWGILARHPSNVSVVFRHFPLQVDSKEAAMAAECAGAQGRFVEYHRLLFSKSDSIGMLSWESFGEQANVPDLAGFDMCVKGGEFEGRLREDWEAARRLGGRGTPILLVNEKLMRGAPREGVLKDLVEQTLTERGGPQALIREGG